MSRFGKQHRIDHCEQSLICSLLCRCPQGTWWDGNECQSCPRESCSLFVLRFWTDLRCRWNCCLTFAISRVWQRIRIKSSVCRAHASTAHPTRTIRSSDRPHVSNEACVSPADFKTLGLNRWLWLHCFMTCFALWSSSDLACQCIAGYYASQQNPVVVCTACPQVTSHRRVCCLPTPDC